MYRYKCMHINSLCASSAAAAALPEYIAYHTYIYIYINAYIKSICNMEYAIRMEYVI